MPLSLRQAVDVVQGVLGNQFTSSWFTAEAMAVTWNQDPTTVSRKLKYNHPGASGEIRKTNQMDYSKFVKHFQLQRYGICPDDLVVSDEQDFKQLLEIKRIGVHGDPEYLKLADTLLRKADIKTDMELKIRRIDDGIFRGIRREKNQRALPEVTLYPDSKISVTITGAKSSFLIILDYTIGDNFEAITPLAPDPLAAVPSNRFEIDSLVECSGPYDKKLSLFVIATTIDIATVYSDALKDHARMVLGENWMHEYESLADCSTLTEHTCQILRHAIESEPASANGTSTGVVKTDYYVSSLRRPVV